MNDPQQIKKILENWQKILLQDIHSQSPITQLLFNNSNDFFTDLENSNFTDQLLDFSIIVNKWFSLIPSHTVSQIRKDLFEWAFYLQGKLYESLMQNDEISNQSELIKAISQIFSKLFNTMANKDFPAQVSQILPDTDSIRAEKQRLERSKSKFISLAAHELKTPLTLIEGYSAMLKSIIESDQNENLSTLIRGIEDGSKRLHEIIDNMIDATLIDNELLNIQFQPVWLKHIFTRLVEENQTYIDQRNLTIIINPFEGLKTQLSGDPVRLLQAFRNILNNAMKFTPDGNEIFIYGEILPGFIEVCIRDTGIGIPQENHSQIFERFSPVDDVALHSSGKFQFKGGGPGLGLRIAKGIIESHGGAIWIESQGRDEKLLPGTTVTVVLPIPSDKNPQPPSLSIE